MSSQLMFTERGQYLDTLRNVQSRLQKRPSCPTYKLDGRCIMHYITGSGTRRWPQPGYCPRTIARVRWECFEIALIPSQLCYLSGDVDGIIRECRSESVMELYAEHEAARRFTSVDARKWFGANNDLLTKERNPFKICTLKNIFLLV